MACEDARRKAISRHIPVIIKRRMHNLIVCESHQQFALVLSLYQYRDSPTDTGAELPTKEEVLVCSEQTTLEELDLFWKRVTVPKPTHLAKRDKLMYVLVGVHLLPYEIQEKAERIMDVRDKNETMDNFAVAIVCAKEHEDTCRMAITYGVYRIDQAAVAKMMRRPAEIAKFVEGRLNVKQFRNRRRNGSYRLSGSKNRRDVVDGALRAFGACRCRQDTLHPSESERSVRASVEHTFWRESPVRILAERRFVSDDRRH